MGSFKFKRLPILDNLEIFTSENEFSYFPFHFHDVLCISLITKGIEQFFTKTDEAFAPLGTISITNIGEVHQNKSALSDGYCYKTIYVSPDVLEHLNGGNPINEIQRVIDDTALANRINSLINTQCVKAKYWEQAISLLLRYQIKSKKKNAKEDRFKLINSLVDENKDEKISTEKLSNLFHMSRYHFIREFKREKGLTPQTFIMLKRLQNVKTDILKPWTLKDIAWANGFFDVSHLNYSFKKFFGTTVNTYINSNILH